MVIIFHNWRLEPSKKLLFLMLYLQIKKEVQIEIL